MGSISPAATEQDVPYVVSSEKKNAFIRKCPGPDAPLYPLDQHPSTWPSCHDAYEVTWAADVGNHLVGLSDVERLKLSRSMGFCPHLRCQLGTVGNSKQLGECPAGLCYTKTENGAPTFGACSFDKDGVFNSGGILGYYRQLRATPKPIYKRRRVVLGGDPTDESPESFINANEVHPGLIITQCPITVPLTESDATLPSAERMMIEQGVQLVIQVDPYVEGGQSLSEPQLLAATSKRGCGVWPAHANYSGLAVTSHVVDHCIVEFRYRLSEQPQADIRHVWYYCWKDFSVPRSEDRVAIRALAEDAARVIQGGGKVMLTCHAGRGRSGTLAAVIIGVKDRLSTHGELIDAIVAMRESRDGLVETPEQYGYITDLLGIRRGSTTGWLPSLLQERGELMVWRAVAASLGLLLLLACARLRRVTGKGRVAKKER